MAIRTLAEIQSDLANERTNGKRKDNSPSVSTWTLLRDLIDSFDYIIDNNMSISTILEEVVEIETHLHSYEIWMEKAAVPAGETNIADEVGTVGGLGAFQLDAGNNNWGSWIQVLGSADTPVRTGKTKFDFHRISIEATERNLPYFIQIGFGASGAAALTAETFTETVLEPLGNQVDSTPIVVQSERCDSGTKVWARCMCPGQNTATMDFYIGLHEYDE